MHSKQPIKAWSMRSNLLITIVVMGLLSVGFTLFTGEVYLRQVLDNHRTSFVEVIELEVHNRWDKLKEEASGLALSIQSSPSFRQTFKKRDPQAITAVLNEHFHRGYVTLGILDLKRLVAYDAQFNIVASSTDGSGEVVCPRAIEQAQLRQGVQRYKTLHVVCDLDHQLRLVTVVPIGGLRLTGYLLIAVDPVHNLSQSKDGIGMPLTISSMNNDTWYRSDDWPQARAMKNVMLVTYGNKAGNKKPVANFIFALDVTALNQRLFKTRISLISIVLLSTLVAMIVAMTLFRKTILFPLSAISEYFKGIHADRKQLDSRLKVSGSQELHELADEINAMTHELSRLYNEFETMAFTDSLTGIPNRALLFDRLRQITLYANRDKSQGEFMLMMMDLNKFKSVNDELGHHVGDQLLVAVADRLKQALRASDTIARLGGDEFSIILYGVDDKQEAIRVAEKINALMNELFVIEGYKLEVGMSIGIARYPHDGSNSESVMRAADMAMYQAKRTRTPYVFYESIADN